MKGYPLEQLIQIKKKRCDDAELTLQQKKHLLTQEEKQLENVKRERDKVANHRDKKLEQMQRELDKGTTTDKIQQMEQYRRLVEEELAAKEEDVNRQEGKVQEAEREVEVAKQELFFRQKELDKIGQHKKEWKKQEKYIELQEENRVIDEIGSVRHRKKPPGL
ncbi:MAG: type III secretion T3S chaperone [Chlamydiales bacterium]